MVFGNFLVPKKYHFDTKLVINNVDKVCILKEKLILDSLLLTDILIFVNNLYEMEILSCYFFILYLIFGEDDTFYDKL
jgi:hypothetical protein